MDAKVDKMETIGQKITRIRKILGLSQIELAEKAGYSPAQISRIENDYRHPSPHLINTLWELCVEAHSLAEADECQVIEKQLASITHPIQNGVFGISKQPNVSNKTPIDYGDYVGTYYLYDFPTSGENILSINQVVIAKNQGCFWVEIENLMQGYHFAGKMTVNEHNLFWDLSVTGFSEKVFCIFCNPIARKIDMLWGIAMVASFAHEPASKIILLSIKKLEENTARELFRKNGYNKNNAILKVPRNKTGLFPLSEFAEK